MEMFMLFITTYLEKRVFSTHFEAQLKGKIRITTEIGQHMPNSLFCFTISFN